MRCASGFYFAHRSQAGVGAWRWRLGFACSTPGREVPEGSQRPVVVVVGAPHPEAGDPKVLLSSLSHAREFLPLDGSIRAKKRLWETLWERGPSSGATFLPGYPAPGRFVLGLRTCGFSSLVFAPFLSLMLHSLPCLVLGDRSQLPKTGCHVTSSACSSSPDACGCRGTCRDRGAESQLGHSGPRPGAKRSQTEQGEEMSTLMGHQNHGFLARCIPCPPKPSLLQLLGCREPRVKVTDPKGCTVLHEKSFRDHFLHDGCRGGCKAPGD